MNIKQIKIEVVSCNCRSAGFKYMQSKAVSITYQFDGCFTTETHSLNLYFPDKPYCKIDAQELTDQRITSKFYMLSYHLYIKKINLKLVLRF